MRQYDTWFNNINNGSPSVNKYYAHSLLKFLFNINDGQRLYNQLDFG